jgi:hypothetical protein
MVACVHTLAVVTHTFLELHLAILIPDVSMDLPALLTSCGVPCEPETKECNECRNATKQYLEHSILLHDEMACGLDWSL